MNVEFIKTDDEKKISIITDGSVFKEVLICEDACGRQYIKLPNLASPHFIHPDSLIQDNFHNRIGDMYECIRNGWGDVICIPSYRYSENMVIRYLDRDFGEVRRHETLKRSHNFKFKNILFVPCEDSPLNAAGEIIPYSFEYFFPLDVHKFKLLEFASEDEANHYIKTMIDAVIPLAELYIRRKNSDEMLTSEFNDYLYNHFDYVTMLIFNHLITHNKCPLYVGQTIDYSDEKWIEIDRPSIEFPTAGIRIFLRDEILSRYKNRYDVTSSTLVFHEAELSNRPSNWTTLPMYRVTDLESIIGNWFLSTEGCLAHPSYQKMKKIAEAKGTILKIERGNVSIDGNYRHDDFMKQVVLNTKHEPAYREFSISALLEKADV